MKQRVYPLWALLVISGIFLTACGSRPTETEIAAPSLTATPDLCAAENIKGEIDKVNRLMREFDDASVLAANTARSELRPAIAELQRIRRAAEDLEVPACLANLKKYQVAHMNQVIDTLIGLMGNADPASVMEGVARARQLHDVYTLEIARLLGITLVPVTPSSQTTGTETPLAVAPTSPGMFVTNPGPTTVNLRAQPALDALNLGLLDINQSAPVVGRSADNQWLLIEIPGQPGRNAWVFTTLVSLSGQIDTVPVVTPAP